MSTLINILKVILISLLFVIVIYPNTVLLIIAALFILIILLKKKTPSLAIINKAATPLFFSSFIQYWYAQNWDENRWLQELNMLQFIGIKELIIQSVVDTKNKYAAYPTKMQGYKYNDIDMLRTALNSADKLNMKIKIGLGFSDCWWTKGFYSINWLNSEAEVNKVIIDELIELYGNHPSLSGWYIPYEFSQLTSITSLQQTYINNFLKQIASHIKICSDKTIMIAPYYNMKFSWLVSLPRWSNMLLNILKDTQIDVLALQDSIGAGFNSISNLARLYSFTRKSMDSLGIKLYAVTETFTRSSSEFISAPQSRISEQLSIEKYYVDEFIAFSINHYQNKNKPSQESNYNYYYEYYMTNRQ